MNMHAFRKPELRPLPMRVTKQQFQRLQDARSRDGLAVQEHVRRALDMYLGKVERDFQRTLPLSGAPNLEEAADGGPRETPQEQDLPVVAARQTSLSPTPVASPTPAPVRKPPAKRAAPKLRNR